MRWMTFDAGDGPRVGRVDGSAVQPVAATDLGQVIADGGAPDRGDPLPVTAVRPLAPLRPGKVIAVGQNYLDHVREQGAEPPAVPVLFPKFPTSVIGPGAPIAWAAGLTEQVDYEAELAVVIGRTATRVGEHDALDHVFGYTAANDVTARDLQLGDGQWTRGKGIDGFLPLGPVVADTREVPDPQQLAVRCRVNGTLVQDGSTADMVFSVARLVAFISAAITLEPGDVVLTGTPNGVGLFQDPPRFLAAGDVVEVRIGDLDPLVNPVAGPDDDRQVTPVPPAAAHAAA
jgi:2-keto-4-pentenoate hydratase/2-oxohepta-3-ene-1,7-dioic acid hydratase in catechol pathway